jgi:hypothetical protein
MRSNISARANFDLEYEIHREEASSSGGHQCPRCGAAVSPGHESDDCVYCGGRLWMIDGEGRRFTYVLTVKGHRQGAAVDQRLPLPEAEGVIARDVELFRGAIATTRKARTALAVVATVVLLITILLLFFFVRSIQTQLERVCPAKDAVLTTVSLANTSGRRPVRSSGGTDESGGQSGAPDQRSAARLRCRL